MSTAEALFEPYALGPTTLANRIVMAPLTRNRALPGNIPGPMTVTYYAQRASAGLIITEASPVCPEGHGYPRTPGIHSAEQTAAWRQVTDAVHAKGGRIFLQLWHVGRISHPSLQPDGAAPVAPSALKPAGQVWTGSGLEDYVTPRALNLDEIPGIIAAYRQAASNAKAAGFDGIEVHGANGYLLDQFLRRLPTSARMPTAARSPTAPACCWKLLLLSARSSAPTASACASRHSTASTTSTIPIRRPPSCLLPMRCARSAWPTCTCWRAT